MIKVRILSSCPRCHGEAYLPVGEADSVSGQPYQRHQPCPLCQGSGTQPEWLSISAFFTLLQQQACPHQHTTFQGGYHFSAGELWDDLVEVCSDCGANLDELPDPRCASDSGEPDVGFAVSVFHLLERLPVREGALFLSFHQRRFEMTTQSVESHPAAELLFSEAPASWNTRRSP